MHSRPVHRPAHTVLLAAALFGGFLAAPTGQAAAAPPPVSTNCTVRSQNVDVTIDRDARTATTTATWNVTCQEATDLTADLIVYAPGVMQRPIKGAYGTRFSGSSTTAGTVDPGDPQQTATLVLREGDKVIGKEVRTCAKKTDGTKSCYTGPMDAVGNGPSDWSGKTGETVIHNMGRLPWVGST